MPLVTPGFPMMCYNVYAPNTMLDHVVLMIVRSRVATEANEFISFIKKSQTKGNLVHELWIY